METISLTAREYAEQNGIALSTAYLWMKKTGVKPRRAEQNTEGKNDKLLRQYREQGLKYFEIAKTLGKDEHNIRKRCIQLGLGYSEEEKPQPEYERRVKEKGFEYISGYENCESIITIKCLKCGEVSQRRYTNLIGGKGTCPKCQRINHEARQKERQRLKEEQQLARDQEREERKRIAQKEKIKRTEERILNGNQMAFGSCPICGSLFFGNKKYCSEQCRAKQERRTKETRRRISIQNNIVDRDITLEELYRRDDGMCYLCEKVCDWNDYTIKNNSFVAGPNYPSIDHVKPLSKGGKHSWGNVKLAHFYCNTLKRDKQAPPSQ